MKTTKNIDYVIADCNNGIIDSYKTLEEAKTAYGAEFEACVSRELENVDDEDDAHYNVSEFIGLYRRTLKTDADGTESGGLDAIYCDVDGI